MLLPAVSFAGLGYRPGPLRGPRSRASTRPRGHRRGRRLALRAPGLEPGGWAFQFENTLYPDVDDTAKVLMALFRAGALDRKEHREKIAKGVDWVLGLQSSDGGWGAFDIDNNFLYLNDIPFADHGALLDPSTSDLTGRCIELLSLLGHRQEFPPIARALRFLRKEQEPCGAWYGRWGVNYIYGTWSVLIALRQLGEDMSRPYVRKAVGWLVSRQNPDGGWGESCQSYRDPSLAGQGASTASQTSWALLGLMAAGEERGDSVRKGIRYLLERQNDHGGWEEELYTGTGFPRVFFLRYHGYGQFFPLWALGVYRRLHADGKMLEDEIRRESPADLPLRKMTEPVKPALGLLVALPAEGRALLGRFGWRRVGGRRTLRTRLPDGSALLCVCSGVGAPRALSAARWLVDEGATALAVLGVSGGLDPALKPGDMIVAETVLENRNAEPQGSWRTDAAGAELLHTALSAEGLTATRGAVLSGDRATLTKERKISLYKESGALCVDMESAAVARAASEKKIPLFVLRAVCDPADQSVPRDLFEVLDEEGDVRPSLLLPRIARNPYLVFELIRTGRAYFAALNSLRRASQALRRAVTWLPSGDGRTGVPR
jgi:nucleoside phosphorylase